MKDKLKTALVSAAATTRHQNVQNDYAVDIPPSLFDPPLVRMRREVRLLNVMTGASNLPSVVSFIRCKPLPLSVFSRQILEALRDKTDWLVQEDWALLQTMQELQGLPLSLRVLSPARAPNWDLASEALRSVSGNYRSPKDCQNRYKNVVVPREEGKFLFGTNLEAAKGNHKIENYQAIKTSELFVQDNNSTFTKVINDHYKWIMKAGNRRRANELRTVLQQPKSVEIASILAEKGIDFDASLTPVQIAERIARQEQERGIQDVDGAKSNVLIQKCANLLNNADSVKESGFNELLEDNTKLKNANIQIKEKIDHQEKLVAYWEEQFSLFGRTISSVNVVKNYLEKKLEADEMEIHHLKLQMAIIQNELESLPLEVGEPAQEE